MTIAAAPRSRSFSASLNLFSLALLLVAGACHRDIAVESTSIAVLPETARVQAGATAQFTAEVNGAASGAVTWSVMSGGAGGTISASGLYTAPTIAGTDTVTATSTVNSSATALAHVTIFQVSPVSTIAVLPATASVLTGGAFTFAAHINGAATTAVTWRVMSGGAGGTIGASGLYTAPMAAGSDTVVATSTADPSKSASAAVTISLAPPASLVYAPSPLLCTLGQSCSAVATHSGGPIASFSISPALPAGLSIDANTGQISGTPTALLPQAQFTVTATNAGGSTMAMIGVAVSAAPPAGLAYSPAELVCTVNAPCSISAPTQTGGAVVSFAISPALPAGLSFNTATGAITGSANGLLARTPFTVTATNSGGSTTVTLYVTVKDLQPKTLVYDPDSLLCYVGRECALAAPTHAGGAITAFTAAPALPAGLFFATNGAIIGVPTIAAIASMYVVTASNSGGSTTAKITIEVLLPLATNAINGTLAAGANHTCALAGSGAFCWGANGSGQLGNASVDPAQGSPVPVPVDGLSSGVEAIVAGFNFTCALVNGTVECWGSNANGKLGNNSTVDSTAPVPVAIASVQQLAAGSSHACALSDGALYCWGSNNQGQLGNGTNQDSLLPVTVGGLQSNSVTAIAAGALHTCAVVAGAVKCWGANGSGQLGVSTGVLTSSPTPVQVGGLSSGARALALGDLHSCAIVDGAMKCWGYNSDGELGNNQTTNSTSAIQVSGLSQGVQAIAAGGFHTCAVVDGAVQCWGFNPSGQLGNNSTADSLLPVASGLKSGVQSLALGLYHSCALVNGGVHCWGNNFDGELGNNSQDDAPVPVQAEQLIDGLAAVATGGNFSCAVVNGGVQCWGGNASGQLGNNSTASSRGAVSVAGLTGVDTVRAGSSHACAIAGGGIFCWGGDADGELGNGTFGQASSVPVQVLGLLSGAQDLSVGASHACAVIDGAAFCWGANASGELGNNSTAASGIPVAVSGLGSGVLSIAAGVDHSCALMTDTTVKCWGDNSQGQLGRSSGSTLIPGAIPMLPPMQKLVAGNQFTCAYDGGDLFCWGRNDHGQLGDGNKTSSPSPQQTLNLNRRVRGLIASGSSACALNDSGLSCWGANGSGQLGVGSTIDSATPVSVPALAKGVLGFASGPASNHLCALVSGGVECWGANADGQLGNNSAIAAQTTPVPVSVLQGLPGH
jgi:alpha-tubulin suppressor-like RCC1 family protein